MASRGSHRWCLRCHKNWVDKRAAHGMCRVCKDEYRRELRAQRSAVKGRRAARMSEDKNLAEPDLSPEVIAAEINVGTIKEPPRPTRGPGGQPKLTPEQRDEIVKLYVTTDESLKDIASTYGVRETYPFWLLKSRGITWRREMGTPPPVLEEPSTNGHVKPEIVDQVPEDVVKALERMVKLPEVPTRPEPVRAIVAAQPTVPSLPEYVERVLPTPQGEETWRVDYEGSILVQASSIEQAIERARADGHIRTINAVTRRTR